MKVFLVNPKTSWRKCKMHGKPHRKAHCDAFHRIAFQKLDGEGEFISVNMGHVDKDMSDNLSDDARINKNDPRKEGNRERILSAAKDKIFESFSRDGVGVISPELVSRLRERRL